MITNSVTRPPSPVAHKWLLLALLLALIQAVLLFRTVLDKSETVDEWRYIHRSVQQWQADNYYCSPVLPHWGFGAALHTAGDPRITAPLTAYRAGALQDNLIVARAATASVVVLGGLLLWLAARRFDDRVGALAHTLWCFSPLLLAHGALVTFDAWTAAACAAVLLAMLRWRERPGHLRAIVLGFALAVAVACKLVALGLIFPLLLLVAFTRRGSAPVPGWPGTLLVIGGATLAGLWALYGFSVETLNTQDLCATGKASSWLPPLSMPLPLAPLIESVLIQIEHGYNWGHTSYLAGETARSGWWWFYLACIALQTTVGAQGLALLRIAGIFLRPRWRSMQIDIVLLAFPLLLILLLSAGKTQRGFQYLLPAFPFVFAFVARVIQEAPRVLGRRVEYLIAVLVLAAVFESVRIHPHHLMFYNLWAGGPSGGPFYLIASNDIGQDKRRLALWQQERGIPEVYYLPYGGHSARLWGLVYRQPTQCRPLPGVYTLNAGVLHKPHPAMRGCLDWLTKEAPDERIGYSIYVYYVDEQRIRRLANFGDKEPFLQTGPKHAP